MKHYIITGSILITALLVAYFYFTPYKYVNYHSGNTIRPVKINRFTGETYYLNISTNGYFWVKVLPGQ